MATEHLGVCWLVCSWQYLSLQHPSHQNSPVCLSINLWCNFCEQFCIRKIKYHFIINPQQNYIWMYKTNVYIKLEHKVFFRNNSLWDLYLTMFNGHRCLDSAFLIITWLSQKWFLKHKIKYVCMFLNILIFSIQIVSCPWYSLWCQEMALWVLNLRANDPKTQLNL